MYLLSNPVHIVNPCKPEARYVHENKKKDSYPNSQKKKKTRAKPLTPAQATALLGEHSKAIQKLQATKDDKTELLGLKKYVDDRFEKLQKKTGD